MNMLASRLGLLVLLYLLMAPPRSCPAGQAPVDAAGRPLILKGGTIECDLVETTPIVFKGRIYRFEWVRPGYWSNELKQGYFRLVDHKTGQLTSPFAFGCEFGSAFVTANTVYVSGTDSNRSSIYLFASKDLKNWNVRTIFHDASFGIFNTSMCKAKAEYVLMFEIDRPADQAGVPFTARFLKSRDLHQWTLTPPECNYAKDRYTAPHCLRYLGGFFYDFYLEAHDGYEVRVVRSRDLVRWEASHLNPVLKASDEDRKILNDRLPQALRDRIAKARNINNSDIDFCEFKGHLLINYSWGNQQGIEFLAEATYAGSEEQFLRGWFPVQPKSPK